jgi:hypothetical protein
MQKIVFLQLLLLFIACRTAKAPQGAATKSHCDVTCLTGNKTFLADWKKDSLAKGLRLHYMDFIDSIAPKLNGDSIECVLKILGKPNAVIKEEDNRTTQYSYGLKITGSGENTFNWNFSVVKDIIQHSEIPIP